MREGVVFSEDADAHGAYGHQQQQDVYGFSSCDRVFEDTFPSAAGVRGGRRIS